MGVLKGSLREADGAKRNMVADDIIGALGMKNETIEGTMKPVKVETNT